eukprot:3166258-Pyramimonas_sp.AAC.1
MSWLPDTLAPVWLFEEVVTGHGDIDLAEWLGIPIGGQPADIECVENFRAPAAGDADVAGAPADSEATIPATDEEIQLMLYPRVIGNPTTTELSDDGPLRGNRETLVIYLIGFKMKLVRMKDCNIPLLLQIVP